MNDQMSVLTLLLLNQLQEERLGEGSLQNSASSLTSLAGLD